MNLATRRIGLLSARYSRMKNEPCHKTDGPPLCRVNTVRRDRFPVLKASKNPICPKRLTKPLLMKAKESVKIPSGAVAAPRS